MSHGTVLIMINGFNLKHCSNGDFHEKNYPSTKICQEKNPQFLPYFYDTLSKWLLLK